MGKQDGLILLVVSVAYCAIGFTVDGFNHDAVPIAFLACMLTAGVAIAWAGGRLRRFWIGLPLGFLFGLCCALPLAASYTTYDLGQKAGLVIFCSVACGVIGLCESTLLRLLPASWTTFGFLRPSFSEPATVASEAHGGNYERFVRRESLRAKYLEILAKAGIVFVSNLLGALALDFAGFSGQDFPSSPQQSMILFGLFGIVGGGLLLHGLIRTFAFLALPLRREAVFGAAAKGAHRLLMLFAGLSLIGLSYLIVFRILG